MKVSTVLLKLSIITASALLTTNAALAEEDAEEKVVIINEAGSVQGIAIVDVMATVQKIDKKTRTITLKKENGETVSIVAPETVRNFEQIKVSDIVHAKYQTSVAFQVVKEGSTEVGRAIQETSSRAKLGEKPSAKLTRAIAMRANVTKVDPKNKTITIQGQDKTLKMDVKNPDHFKVVKVGDQIDALITESIAISVTGAKKK
jgi:Cu/Ag efflux protein CusF